MLTKPESKVETYVPMHGPLRAGLWLPNRAIVLDSYPDTVKGSGWVWSDGPELYIREEGIVLAYCNIMSSHPFVTWSYLIQQRRISLPDGLETWEETIACHNGDYSMTLSEALGDLHRRSRQYSRRS